jgi:hypothetical protein
MSPILSQRTGYATIAFVDSEADIFNNPHHRYSSCFRKLMELAIVFDWKTDPMKLRARPEDLNSQYPDSSR